MDLNEFKTVIILKDKVVLSDSDCFASIMNELKVDYSTKEDQKNYVYARIFPECLEDFGNIDSWIYEVYNSILPDWYNPQLYEGYVRNEVKDWAREHIHINKKKLVLNGGVHYVLNCDYVTVNNNAKIIAYDCNKINATDNSIVKAYNGSKVLAMDNCTVYADNDCFVNACDSSNIYTTGNNEIIATDFSCIHVLHYCTGKITAHCYATVFILPACIYDTNNCKLDGSAVIINMRNFPNRIIFNKNSISITER